MKDGAIVKSMSLSVSISHALLGASYVLKDGQDAQEAVDRFDLVVVNLFKDDEARRIAGARVTPKDIRRCLFDWKFDRRSTRPNMVLCTVYSPDRNISYVCLGALVQREVAQRLVARNPDYCIVMEPSNAR